MMPPSDLLWGVATLSALALAAWALAVNRRLRRELTDSRSKSQEALTEARGKIHHRRREVKTLRVVAAALTAEAEQARPAFSAVVTIVARYLKADLAALMALDEATMELVTQPGAFGLDSEDQFYRIPISAENSSSVRVFKSGEPFMTGDAQSDPSVTAGYAKLWNIRSLMVVPLKTKSHSLGVLRVGSVRPDSFTPDDLRFARLIADEVAILVETAMLNRKLSWATEQLEALNRIKDEFVSTASHEFRTPLTTLGGFLTILMEGEAGPLTDKQTGFLNMALKSVRRLEAIVLELLDLTRLEGGVSMEMRPLRIAEIVESSVDSLAPQAVSAQKIVSTDIPGDLPLVMGDPKWLSLVVDNILSNALKFTRPGGQVRIAARDKGEFIVVSVQDNGIGIPASEHNRIFEKFFRASNHAEVKAPGTGLGLALCREVISKHGGRIWFESQPGLGTTFHFLLARQRESAGADGEGTPR